MTRGVRSFFLPLVAALAVIAVIAGFFARGPLERALFVRAVQRATGLTVAIDGFERDGDAYEVSNLRASTPGGAALVAAARARVRLSDERISVELDHPHFIFDPDRYRGNEAKSLPHNVDVTVVEGLLVVVSGAVPEPVLSFDGIAGHLELAGSRARYNVALALEDGGMRYPLFGQSLGSSAGPLTQSWSVPVLPVNEFAVLASPGGDIQLEGGRLRDVAITAGHGVQAQATLEDVDVALGSHALVGIHGPISYESGALGSAKLAGEVDGIPADFSGEVHDLAGGAAWLRSGSNDLRRVARLLARIADEPNVRAVHVETTAPGLAYAQYALGTDHGPLAISLLSIDPHEPTLRFDTAIAEDRVISGGERTSAMGVRTGAVAGVNGDYFDIGRTYQPQGLLVRDGTLMRGPADRAALTIDKSNNVTIAEFHLLGRVLIGGRAFPVTQFNNWPAGDVTIITPAFGKILPAAEGTTFAALEQAGSDGRHFRVLDVQAANAPLPVRFGLAFGPMTHATLHAGETIELSYRFDPPLGDAVAGIGGGPILIKDGAWYEDPHAPAPDERDYRWPVIALAKQTNGDLMLVAVDGRHPERSVGMTRPEFAALLLRFGATGAMALDSGGSVTLVSRAPGDKMVTVRNVPSDNSAERWVSDALFLYSAAPQPSIVTPAIVSTPVPEARPSP
jgi:exopolysaccharide biosynthesis protein